MFKVWTKKRTGEDSPGKATRTGLDEEKVRGERPGKDTRAWLVKKQTGWTWTGQGPRAQRIRPLGRIRKARTGWRALEVASLFTHVAYLIGRCFSLYVDSTCFYLLNET